jgi:hypothetical protein
MQDEHRHLKDSKLAMYPDNEEEEENEENAVASSEQLVAKIQVRE